MGRCSELMGAWLEKGSDMMGWDGEVQRCFCMLAGWSFSCFLVKEKYLKTR